VPSDLNSSYQNQEELSTNKKNSFVSSLQEFLSLVLTAVILAGIIYLFIAQSFWIPSESMENTIMPGDRVIVAKFYYHIWKPKPGDIVVINSPDKLGAGQPDLIKRVIGVSGDKIEEKDGVVYRNGKRLTEPYARPDSPTANFDPINVPKKHIFLMGDNRPNSKDSRYFGSVPLSKLVGRALFTYWPPSRIGILK
jgi:signal peptidase I